MISVIVPMYNAAESIVSALDSVKNQTFPQEEFEIIIINDGSTDESSILAENYIQENPQMDIILLNQKNGGVSSARNTGLRIAKGDYIALLDADDEWNPTKIEKQIYYFEKMGTGMDFLATARNNNRILSPYHIKNGLAQITFKKLLIRNEAQPSTVMFRRKVLENTGYFDDNQRYAEDVNYWMKISLKNKMYILSESLVIIGKGKRSFGVSGLSANLPEMAKGFKKNLKEMYLLKKINLSQYILFRLFYRTKYLFLLFRTFYFNLNKTKKQTSHK
ncbi:Glycosyltransferase involved in cell wall bisynthesis [Chryseobacterium arachidis]|uniref:Glycosyltransferase involved in cell wall bisynthesis n=1 Tax=Chryseobacterium arachidis TaxID=1416778 RepID=A0A1M4SQX6_9FLAO|nr:glycosyltransferase family 2 protein [Chryseobacterium arachidis]SHE34653.1 Glycosyltransferase involved in cell wall bisynthesis [Chryseobacterium arachidis]